MTISMSSPISNPIVRGTAIKPLNLISAFVTFDLTIDCYKSLFNCPLHDFNDVKSYLSWF